MKKLLTVSNGLLTLSALALLAAFSVATIPSAVAQGNDARNLIQQELGSGNVQTAGKADFLQAVCAAVKKNRGAAPQITRAAIMIHGEWKNDILRTVFECLGSDDCRLLGRVLRAAIAASPGDADSLTQLATELAPNCAGSFGGQQPDDDFGPTGGPASQTLLPGTAAAGGGQGNVIAICHNDHTIFVSPQGAEAHLQQHPGDSLGPCQVTPVTNQ